MENLSQHIEAIIFTSEQPVTETLVCDALNKIYGFDITEEEVKELIQEIGERYTSEQYAIELKRAGGGWQFLTKSDFHPTVAGFLQHKSKKKLSNSALETQ